MKVSRQVRRRVGVAMLCSAVFLSGVAMASAPSTEPPIQGAESTPVEGADVLATEPGATADSISTSAPARTEVQTSTASEATAPSVTAEAPATSSPTTAAATTTAEAADEESPSPFTGPPPTVDNVQATLTYEDRGSTRVRVVSLSWTGTDPEPQPRGITDDLYKIERRFSQSDRWEYVTDRAPSSPFVDTFLDDATFGWYQYRVSPYFLHFVPVTGDHDWWEIVEGQPGYVSVLVTAVIYPPSLPRSLRVTTTATGATVSWAAPTTADGGCEETGYDRCDPATLYVVSFAPAGGTWHGITTTSTSHILDGLRTGATYFVNVRAMNDGGRGPVTPSVRVIPASAPVPVPSMRAIPGNGEVTLQWTAPVDNGSPITRYAIQQRRADSSTWEYISTATPASARTFTARSLTDGSTYHFRIVAINDIGWSGWSIPVVATSLPSATPPTGGGGGGNAGGGGAPAPAPPSLSQRFADSPLAADWVSQERSWIDPESPLFSPLTLEQTRALDPTATEPWTPADQVQRLSEELDAVRGSDGSRWILEVVDHCNLRFVTFDEVQDQFSAETARGWYNLYVAATGHPPTNWDLINEMEPFFNVTPNSAQLAVLEQFTAARWADAVANTPGLTAEAFLSGSREIGTEPPTTEPPATADAQM